MVWNYKKTGRPGVRDRIRCPCCGWVVPGNRFNPGKRYDWGVFSYWYCGKGDIRVEKKKFLPGEVELMRKSLLMRLREVAGYLGGNIEPAVPVERISASARLQPVMRVERVMQPIENFSFNVPTPARASVSW
jgi:hypothetical protein